MDCLERQCDKNAQPVQRTTAIMACPSNRAIDPLFFQQLLIFTEVQYHTQKIRSLPEPQSTRSILLRLRIFVQRSLLRSFPGLWHDVCFPRASPPIYRMIEFAVFIVSYDTGEDHWPWLDCQWALLACFLGCTFVNIRCHLI